MSDGFYTAAAGAMAHIHAMDTIANNLANASTAGFKQQVATFREIQRRADSEVSRQVALDSIRSDFRNGTVMQTGNPMDIALRDDSFFVIDVNGREQFTRAGNFRLDETGMMVTADGNPLLSDSGPILAEAGAAIRINADGQVIRENQTQLDPSQPNVLGRIRRVRFERVGLLQPVGGGRFEAPLAAGQQESQAPVETGALEGSNVSVVASMTEMIWVARAYEMFHRGMTLMDQMSSKAANEINR